MVCHGFKVVYVGGAGFVDGPKIGPIMAITNRLRWMRWLSFALERFLGAIPLWKYFGRHVILKAYKS
jgi:hypothetical protein